MSEPEQAKRVVCGKTGFRDVTLVGARGKILAYADRAAIGSHTIGFTGVTLAPSTLPRLLSGRPRHITVLVAGKVTLKLMGFTLSFPSGAQTLSPGGWISDVAIGTFLRILRLPNRGARLPRCRERA